MKKKEIKANAMVVNELVESYSDLLHAINETIKEAKTTQKLWRTGDKSRLIKLGVALIVFPEPTPISETIGSVLVAAGLVQSAVRRRSLYVDDVFKTFRQVINEIGHTKHVT